MRTSKSWTGQKLQKGQAGEIAAQIWFKKHCWNMIRTQPAIQILGVKPGKIYGTVFTVRMIQSGGVPDFTGFYQPEGLCFPMYRAVEVKEATGTTMPASRLDKAQRAFMSALPAGCAYVGILWGDGKFEMFDFIEKGSYKKGG